MVSVLHEPDRGQIEQHVDAVFRHCWKLDGIVSLRSFTQDNKPRLFENVPVKSGFKYLCDAAEDKARRAANEVEKLVFCPPLAVLDGKEGRAREKDLLAGPVLSVECDKTPAAARRRLEQILGPATVIVESGGEWQAPDGELQKKSHLHWRLSRPATGNDLAKLKHARDLAHRIVGGDTSNVPLVHPLRWPGSWHRKGEPVMCSIAKIDPDREIDLDQALAALEGVAHQEGQTTNGHDRGGNGFDRGTYEQRERVDWAAMTQNIIGGTDWHVSTLRLAASYIGSGISHEHTLRQLQALMMASPQAHDERWKARFDNLDRLIREGVEKYGTAANEKAQNSSPEFDVSSGYIFVGDTAAAPPEELIKGLIPKQGVAVTGGQSSAGKTFIKIHKSICLYTGIPYFGHKIVERVGTVFVAAEGRPLLPNRFAAALAKGEIKQHLPICWPRRLPDFSTADGIKKFIAELKEIDRRYRRDYGVRLGHTVIDTVAANFNMKDEDDNAEATKICNIARSVGEEAGTLIALVHHYGKDPASGLRGASAWKGSADVIEGVLADIDPLSGKASNRELVCAKARDGEQGPLSAFDLEFVELGIDEDSETYGSVCVVPKEGESRFGKGKAPSKSQRAVTDAIDEALDTCGEFITPRAGMPQVKAAKVSDIRAEFDRRYVVDAPDPIKAADAKRKAFKRALDYLSPAKFGAGSAQGTDWVWKTA